VAAFKQDYASVVGAAGTGAQVGGAVARLYARGAIASEERDNGRIVKY